MRVLLGIVGILLLIAGIVWGPVELGSRLRDGLPNQFDRLMPNFTTPQPRGQITERIDGYRHYAWAFERARSDSEIRAIKQKIDAELKERGKFFGSFTSAAPRILQTGLSAMVIFIAFGMALCFANATASAIVGILAGVFQELIFVLPSITGGEVHWFVMSGLGGFLAGIVAHATAGRLVKRLRQGTIRGPVKRATTPVNVPAPATGAAKGVGTTIAAGRATPLRVAAPTITGNAHYTGAVVQRRRR